MPAATALATGPGTGAASIAVRALPASSARRDTSVWAVALGQMIEPSKPAFEIAELSTLWLVVHAFEREAVRVKVGAPARVTLPAMPGRTFTGTVRLVGRQVDVESRTVPVRLDMPNPDRTLRPGMAGMAAIVLSETAGRIITVPVAALQRMADRWVVFIPKGASTFEVRTVDAVVI